MRAGDIVVCDVDCVIGTDASAPMAIDYFERMGGTALFDPSRVLLRARSLLAAVDAGDRGVSRPGPRVRRPARRDGVRRRRGHQPPDRRRARACPPGDLVIGADSHTVTCGALNCFATGVGSSDLAAAHDHRADLAARAGDDQGHAHGAAAAGLAAKDIALALVARTRTEGANYQAIEFTGHALSALPLEDRLVLSNLRSKAGAKAAIFPHDAPDHRLPPEPGRRHRHAGRGGPRRALRAAS